jgi:hypothetical protein
MGILFAAAYLVLGIFVSLLFQQAPPMSVLFVSVLTIAFFVSARLLWSFTNVWIDGELIYFSRGRREARLKLSDIVKVDQSLLGHLLNIEYAYIICDQETPFGKKIYFTPPFRLSLGLTPHPVIEELDGLAQKAKWETGLPKPIAMESVPQNVVTGSRAKRVVLRVFVSEVKNPNAARSLAGHYVPGSDHRG